MGKSVNFFSIQLSNFHDADPRFDVLTWFEGLTQLIQFFFLHISFFLFLINLFNYHALMTRPYNQTHIQYFWIWCCNQDSFKLKSCKFNIIINIINITLGSSIAAKPMTFRYNFAEKPNIFKFYFIFNIFYVKKNYPSHHTVI